MRAALRAPATGQFLRRPRPASVQLRHAPCRSKQSVQDRNTACSQRPGTPRAQRSPRKCAISPGTLCFPRHAAASSRRKGRFAAPFRRPLAAAPPSAACRWRDAWLRGNDFSLPCPHKLGRMSGLPSQRPGRQSRSHGQLAPAICGQKCPSNSGQKIPSLTLKLGRADIWRQR